MFIDEKKIQFALKNLLYGKGYYAVIPNVRLSWLRWEADVVGITKARYLYEFEIKISRHDFLNDFSKMKHSFFKQKSSNYFVPNYFCYVAPISAMPLCVPEYAGLIEVTNDRNGIELSLKEIRRPQKIHGKKLEQKDMLKIMRTTVFKYWDLSQVLEYLIATKPS